MPGITSRKLLIDSSGGRLRPHDFNLVRTDIGSMLEPCSGAFQRQGIGTQASSNDWTDMMSRVDGIEWFSLDKQRDLLGDGCTWGTMIPRSGK